MINSILQLLATLFLAYIIGSIPTGYLIVKTKTGQDIRTIGSGSTGATNVKRVLGKKWFFIVMALDALKGALPVILAKLFVTAGVSLGLAPVIAAVAVIIGHSKSCFLGFKGGKSVASGVGTILALNWMVGLIIAVVWGIITYSTKYVSVGSMIALFISPFLMYFLGAPVAFIGYCALGAVYIIYLHRENIKRLIAGNENKVR
ncbi:MAG: glycerol-3-phosphate 1-O-acyltransferase PlsY [Candidatus Gastranaerophilales bacterium]|nr:glycerol-3-phosphate 1-O-acyltransferase PlsY [Candidatus Gastranaerophilales bacterium]MCM1073456.1 glycerol-3-phosphate 1-O-acyltransferase PlsY [Bacteroides sp.]